MIRGRGAEGLSWGTRRGSGMNSTRPPSGAGAEGWRRSGNVGPRWVRLVRAAVGSFGTGRCGFGWYGPRWVRLVRAAVGSLGTGRDGFVWYGPGWVRLVSRAGRSG